MANGQDKSVISVSPEVGRERCSRGANGGPEILDSDDSGGVLVAQLRARIEQQSSLIAMLKQRSDETFKELGQCRILCETNAAHNQELRKNISEVSRAKSVLEQRFHTLSSNHDELTRIMEEYKRSNGKLRSELEEIKKKAGVSAELEEKEKQLLALREALAGKDKRLKLLEGRCSVLEEEIRELQTTDREREEMFTMKLERQKQQQKAVEQKLTETQAKLEKCEAIQTQLRKNNDDLHSSLHQKDASIKEVASENNRLQLEIRKLQSEKEALSQDIERLSVELSSDVQVSRLQKELRDEQRKREKLLNEYLAYQKHSSEQLRKEQELNDKLRHFSDL